MGIIWTEDFESGLGSWTTGAGGNNQVSQSSEIAWEGSYSAKFHFKDNPSGSGSGESPQLYMYRSAGGGIQTAVAFSMMFRVKNLIPAYRYREGATGGPMRLFMVGSTAGVIHVGVALMPCINDSTSGSPSGTMNEGNGYGLCAVNALSAPNFDDGGFAGWQEIHDNNWHHVVMNVPRDSNGPFEVYLDGLFVHSSRLNTSSIAAGVRVYIGDTRTAGAAVPNDYGLSPDEDGIYHVDYVQAATALSFLTLPQRTRQGKLGRVSG